jgi:MFS family permease
MSFVFFFANAFLAAFLLFQIQPLAGKLIMPTYGGATSVWTACLLFFQVTLLAGYGYAFLLATICKPRTQIAIHTTLLVIAVVATEKNTWSQFISFDMPVIDVLLFLSTNIGFAIVLLAATSPLLQTWFHCVHPSTSPYRMYAFSNAGSLLGLLSYPFLIEPIFMLGQQVQGWAWGVVLYAVLTIPILRQVTKAVRLNRDTQASTANPKGKRPATILWVWWITLAACGVSLLLSVTNELCRDIAPVPLMWILPLVVYLLTFILTFEYERSYNRNGYAIAFVSLVVLLAASIFLSTLILDIVLLLAVIFVGCMVCHGELFRSRPSADYLTLFYLSISFGGACGGVFISLLAPVLFNGYYEYGISTFSCCVILLLAFRIDRWAAMTASQRKSSVRSTTLAYTCMLAIFIAATFFISAKVNRGTLLKKRSFFGVVSVRQVNHPTPRLELVHASTIHGIQALDEKSKHLPTSYYGPSSGIGLAVNHYKERPKKKQRLSAGINIAAVGLGIGTLSAYLSEGDSIRFYEIDPMIIDIANNEFSFLADARSRGVDVSTVAGDGRISLQQESDRTKTRRYDIIVVDAFSGDSIPSHLLTRECFEIYWSLLSIDGTLAIHTSNQFVDLEPVIRAQQFYQKAEALVVRNRPNNDLESPSNWILLTKNEDLKKPETLGRYIDAWEDPTRMTEWTDDYSSLLGILKPW